MRIIKLFIILMMTFHFGMICAQGDSIKQTTEKHELNGKATYYGDRYKETRRTANGERFDKEAYTAAHKTLPFGTIVKVTNTSNGKSVVVRINDRGPFCPGRIIDVTPVAANDLDMIKPGVVPCKVAIISMPLPKWKNKS